MKKIFLLTFIFITLFLINPSTSQGWPGDECYRTEECDWDEVCVPKSETPRTGTSPYICAEISKGPGTIFGKISPPTSIVKLGVGSVGIDKFLNKSIILLYILATIVLVFMILWGAVEWILSGGDKEKVANAQKRITNAVIGIALFAIAFAAIKILGQFTGFTFFVGQNP